MGPHVQQALGCKPCSTPDARSLVRAFSSGRADRSAPMQQRGRQPVGRPGRSPDRLSRSQGPAKRRQWDRSDLDEHLKSGRDGRGSPVQYEQQEAPQLLYAHTFFATCHPGLEQVVADELTALGIPSVMPGKAGVTFRSNHIADGYRANLWLRAAIRVLLLLGSGTLDTSKDGYESLYELVRNSGVRWHDVIPKGASISIEPRVWSCTNITSSRLVWMRVKDAVCDAVWDARGERLQPPPQGQLADVPLYVSAYQDQVNIYRDMSGNSLHRRGYREGSLHRSPLNEAAAAGVLMLAGWHTHCKQDPEPVLVDPMCGSGTILAEAALIAHSIAPGLARAAKGQGQTAAGRTAFPCQAWPDADHKAWTAAVEEAQQAAKSSWKGRMYGNEIHPGALSIAMRDLRSANMTHCIRLHQGSCGSWQLPEVPDLVVTNPPWGMRLMNSEYDAPRDSQASADAMGSEPEGLADLQLCWRELSDFLRAECPDTDVMVLSGNKDNFNYLRMRTSAKHLLTVGGVDVRAHMYHVLPAKQP